MRVSPTRTPWILKATNTCEIMGYRDGIKHRQVIAQTFGRRQIAEANALLISKAPELLAKLKECERELSRLRGGLLPIYAGKIGEPDKLIVRRARKLINQLEVTS